MAIQRKSCVPLLRVEQHQAFAPSLWHSTLCCCRVASASAILRRAQVCRSVVWRWAVAMRLYMSSDIGAV